LFDHCAADAFDLIYRFFIFAIAEKAADRCHTALLDTVLGYAYTQSDSPTANMTLCDYS
jgi:hypothetical protein